ncbi:MAG: glutamate-cysteine ligase family protein [Deltaproteobacteria bacterium]
MSDYIADVDGPDAEPLENIDQLVAHILRGAKPESEWVVGTEVERVGVDAVTAEAIPFSGPRGIEAILRGMCDEFGWAPVLEEGRIIGLSRGDADITLEPGGQVELAGQPFRSLHEGAAELTTNGAELSAVAASLGRRFVGLGIQPVTKLDEIEWVPKGRYGIMGPYMKQVGQFGQRMMKQTATVQVNLDFASEADAIDKMRVGIGIGPLLNAMLANSSISEGRRNGYLSYRAHVWTDTDAARCGILPFLFAEGAGVVDYVEWALDAPMYFVKREGDYLDLSGVPFRHFWEEGADGIRATVGDFALHLSTLFPEVRLKTWLELRMADSPPPDSLLALSAIAKGLLYEDDCRQAAWDLVKGWDLTQRHDLLEMVARGGFAARAGRHTIGDLAAELLTIAEEGLRRLDRRDGREVSEVDFLERTIHRVARRRSAAEEVADIWQLGGASRARMLVDYTAYPTSDDVRVSHA